MMTRKIIFWIFTIIAIVCLILSPTLAYYFHDVMIGGLLLGGSIIGWLGMIITEETYERKEKQDS